MAKVITGTKAQIEQLAAAVDAAKGLPLRGTNVGGGIHVAVSDAPGLGWATTWCEPQQGAVTKSLWLYEVDSLSAPELDNAKKDVTGIKTKQPVDVDPVELPIYEVPLKAASGDSK